MLLIVKNRGQFFSKNRLIRCFEIKVISLEDNDMKFRYVEHEAPILCVASDPTGEFIASSSCDGTVKVWFPDSGETETTLKVLEKCNHSSNAESKGQLCWSDGGEFLLVPLKSEVHVYLRSSWEVTKKIKVPQIKGVINVIAMSHCGTYIAVGTVDGVIAVIDWKTMSIIKTFEHPKHITITSIAWHPKDGNQLAFCDKMGQLGFLTDFLAPSEKPDTSLAVGDADDNVDMAQFHDVLDGDDENSIDIGSLKRRYEIEANDDAESLVSNKDGAVLPGGVPAFAPAPLPAPTFKQTPLQGPFQSGSTPEHIDSRFMVWNSVGIVKQYTSEDFEENSIDVEFHSTATHHALHIDNKHDFVMADLSSTALLLASRGDEETPSKLTCMHFGSWDSHKEWSFTMPDGDNIQAITATDKWVAVATESRNIRMFTVGGIQCQIFSLPGNVVSLSSKENKLMAVYHKGRGAPGDQYLGTLVINVKGKSQRPILRDETLPLSPSSKLSWAGFSDEGLPCYMDSDGVVRIIHKGFGSQWMPIANTKQHAKGKSDNYWLIGLSGKQQQLRCIPCKGSHYPATLPRPVVAVLPLAIPLCDEESEKTKYEESFQRSCLVAHSVFNEKVPETCQELGKAVPESIMKMFAFAAKAERHFQAMEVCNMIETQDLLKIAMAYATKQKKLQLAERVSEMLLTRQEEAEAEEDENCEEEEEEEMESDIEEEVEEEPENTSLQIFSPAQPVAKKMEKQHSIERKNPFKISTPTDRSQSKGSHVFDKIQKPTPKSSPIFAPLPVSIKKSNKKGSISNSSQGKLKGFTKTEPTTQPTPKVKKEAKEEAVENQPIEKKMSAFDLWFQANKDDLIEEHPELSEDDVGQQAAESFRALSKEDRQIWVQKAKLLNSSSEEGSQKRKLSDAEEADKNVSREADAKKMKTASPNEKKKTPLSQSTNAKLARFAKTD